MTTNCISSSYQSYWLVSILSKIRTKKHTNDCNAHAILSNFFFLCSRISLGKSFQKTCCNGGYLISFQLRRIISIRHHEVWANENDSELTFASFAKFHGLLTIVSTARLQRAAIFWKPAPGSHPGIYCTIEKLKTRHFLDYRSFTHI